ncbi:MAG: NAD(P)/FAD-dependent oxidoreductase [Balneolaceae bacterium]
MPITTRSTDYDAIIVGSGPNGLSAGIRLALEGLRVQIVEASHTVGGGMRTRELIRPGYWHDICSAIHPMAVSSPFFKQIPLKRYGLEWIHPIHPVAHPLDNEPVVVYHKNLNETAFHLGEDENIYKSIVQPLSDHWDELAKEILSPLTFPSNPLMMANFGLKALQPASRFQHRFKTERARALFAGMAAHSFLPLDSYATTAIGLVFFGAGHSEGWPMAKGGSQSIANSLAAYFISLGGVIETDIEVKNLDQLPTSTAVLFDLTPIQVARIVGDDFPLKYRQKLAKFHYGSGVFKIDYILREPVPWKDYECKRAGTIHLGGTFDEISNAEKKVFQGEHPDNPFVLVAQQSLFDSTRTPDNKHTLWAYCHVPNGSTVDMTQAIEYQIERFAPGFKDVIESRVTMNTNDFQNYNANYFGGDINGGRQDLSQLFARPVSMFNPYATPLKGIYFCSSSTPPGGGVHGMCGYHAAELVLKKEFHLHKSKRNFAI